MKFVLNSDKKSISTTELYIDDMKDNLDIDFFVYDNYKNYDVALFICYGNNIDDLIYAKKTAPHLKIGIIDPRGYQLDLCSDFVDFIIIDSIEMKDFVSKYDIPIFTFIEHPNFKNKVKKHIHKDKIIIGYHGNRMHIQAMYPKVTKALESLGSIYNLEFWAIYNVKNVGLERLAMPKNVKVRHIPWNPKVYEEVLSKVDIGIVPTLMKTDILDKNKHNNYLSINLDNSDDEDYLIKFKMPSNPGRIIVFYKLGIPVVSDMFPSACHFIRDEHSGSIAYSEKGWFASLEKQILDHNLRNKYVENFIKDNSSRYDCSVQSKELCKFINALDPAKRRFKFNSIEKSSTLSFVKQHYKEILGSYFGSLMEKIRN